MRAYMLRNPGSLLRIAQLLALGMFVVWDAVPT